jgi:hypothetical protein
LAGSAVRPAARFLISASRYKLSGLCCYQVLRPAPLILMFLCGSRQFSRSVFMSSVSFVNFFCSRPAWRPHHIHGSVRGLPRRHDRIIEGAECSFQACYCFMAGMLPALDMLCPATSTRARRPVHARTLTSVPVLPAPATRSVRKWRQTDFHQNSDDTLT